MYYGNVTGFETLAQGVPAFDSVNQCAFRLHAYLLACFSDMPAIAKVMCMKGHNGKSPRTNYVPLLCPFAVNDHGPKQYLPNELPLRHHKEFLQQAKQVESTPTDTKEDKRSRHFGINGLSPLSRLSSLSFPTSFPHDVMHLMFENVVPTLIDLWTRSRKFASFGTGREDYLLEQEDWNSIGAACAASGNTIPAAFGCRITNLAASRQTTSESMLHFVTLLAPALLRGRFQRSTYYTHFLKLVWLINLCLAFDVWREGIKQIRTGFAEWVADYEWLVFT
ncbi:hypothetical protein BDV93DRAFT_531710 [Ceratobasidium sp. AG-I]|nr:hypothetical protein BDV93DRAFT_531710 [Ceratobasidium sp. AG-I]